MTTPMHERAVDFLKGFQDRLCSGLEAHDGQARFREDQWTRPEGGGGRSRVIENGGLVLSLAPIGGCERGQHGHNLSGGFESLGTGNGSALGGIHADLLAGQAKVILVAYWNENSLKGIAKVWAQTS